MKLKLLTFILFSFLIACQKAPTREERIDSLGKQLRCPVCRGVPISDSPSDLAKEMMTVVKEQVDQGKTDEEVLRFFEERYGEWALLEPKKEGLNWMIWIFPVLLVIGGSFFIIRFSKNNISKS